MAKKQRQEESSPKERLDTMPEPLRAIECIRRKDYDGIRSANKCGKVVFASESVRYNLEIGNADEGLG